ncbi:MULTISPECIES: hypothetical protein [unclassified Bradyrhizobium]
MEGHAETSVAALECEFQAASTDAWNMAASNVQYYIDTAKGWKVNPDSFSFDGPTSVIIDGKEHEASLSIIISRQSGKVTKTLSSSGKSLTLTGECKKMDASGRKF